MNFVDESVFAKSVQYEEIIFALMSEIICS